MSATRTESIIGMALKGNPAEMAAVACLFKGKRFGKKIGRATNCVASMYGVELALDCAAGESITIVTCNTYAGTQKNSGELLGISSRINQKLKLSRSEILFRHKRDEPAFDLVNKFARTVLLSNDPVWRPDGSETDKMTASRAADDADSRIESPAESPIYEAMKEHFPNGTYLAPDNSQPWRTVPAFRGAAGILVPQFKIGAYRADFAVIGKHRRLVVEVDGWTYHSSREAFENDRRRDRELQLKGWIPVHFTATDAMYEPAACAEQVLEILQVKDHDLGED